jgi:hypothetical protein
VADPGRAAYARLMAQSEAQGDCYMCGGASSRARHRLWDAVDGALRAGDSRADVLRMYGMLLRPRELDRVQAAYRWARRNHRALPGRARG